MSKFDSIRERIAELDTLAARQSEIEAEAAALLADESATLAAGDTSPETISRLTAQAARRATLERLVPAITSRAAAVLAELKAELKTATDALAATLRQRRRKVSDAMVEKLVGLGIERGAAEAAAKTAESARAIDLDVSRIEYAAAHGTPADVLAALDAISP